MSDGMLNMSPSSSNKNNSNSMDNIIDDPDTNPVSKSSHSQGSHSSLALLKREDIPPEKLKTLFYVLTENGHIMGFNLYMIECLSQRFASISTAANTTTNVQNYSFLDFLERNYTVHYKLDGVNNPTSVLQCNNRPSMIFMADGSYNVKIYDNFQYKMEHFCGQRVGFIIFQEDSCNDFFENLGEYETIHNFYQILTCCCS